MGFGTNESSNDSSTGSETSLPVHYILDHSLSGLFILKKEVTTMYRPQYLEQKHEVITVQNGNGEIVRKYRRPIKSDTYKRKESNEVIPLYGKRIAKY